MDLNASGITKTDAFAMSPRRLVALWKNWTAFRPDLEKRQSRVARVAQADEKHYIEYLKGK